MSGGVPALTQEPKELRDHDFPWTANAHRVVRRPRARRYVVERWLRAELSEVRQRRRLPPRRILREWHVPAVSRRQRLPRRPALLVGRVSADSRLLRQQQ